MAGLNLAAFQGSDFRLRLASSLILAPVALLAVYLGGWVFTFVIMLATGLGLREWLRLVEPAAPKPVITFACVALAFVLIIGTGFPVVEGCTALFALTIALFCAAKIDHSKKPHLIASGLPYMAGSGLAMIYLRELPQGMALVIFLLIVVWGTDIGAYIAGRLIGGPKLAPVISPGKTWAGLLGGMALAACLGYAVALGFGRASPFKYFLLAVLLAGVAQAGDLFKSFFKRRAGVKDSGHMIPGHGGVLDRIDGLVFAAVFLALVKASESW